MIETQGKVCRLTDDVFSSATGAFVSAVVAGHACQGSTHGRESGDQSRMQTHATFISCACRTFFHTTSGAVEDT